MKQRRTTLTACGAVGLAFAAGLIASPSFPSQPEEMDPAKMAWMTTDEHHQALEPFLGEWEGKVKFWMEPGGEPMESAGTASREWAMDGRFIIEHVTSSTDENPEGFHGMGILGYNTVEHTYETVWIENMATYISFMQGNVDTSKKTMTFEGEAIDPMSGKRVHSRFITDFSNPRRHTSVGYSTGPDGKEYKNFEGVMEKTK